jgi:serine protease Do
VASALESAGAGSMVGFDEHRDIHLRERTMKLNVLATTLAAAGVLATGYGFLRTDHPMLSPAHAVPPQPQAAAALLPRGMPDFATIVEQAGPAVVNIRVVAEAKPAAGPSSGPPSANPYEEFFRRFGVPQENVPRGGQGSGFIVSADGLILTNAHVVRNASEVTVKLTDRRELKAKVLGIDARSDVAVLKVDARGLPTVKLGDSRGARVGEWVLAIGSPFGFENTVTAGIVSAKSRAMPGEGYVPFIQTDVAVNPGNSGGPLFNLAGEVIGINSQIYSRSGGYQGLAFAIPIEVALQVKDQLVSQGFVARGRLGIVVQEVNASLAESFGLPKPQGVLVAGVERGGPGERGGLREGDVILRLDGAEVRDSSGFPADVASRRPGTQVKLEVWRSGGRRDVTVTLGELRDAVAAR